MILELKGVVLFCDIFHAECRTLELVDVLQDLKRSATLALRWKTCA